MSFSSITNQCLINDFKLETNLSEVGGQGFNILMESLNLLSISMPNVRIIERIMYHHDYVFNNPESIKEIMRKSEPVISAFAILGNSDRNCNIRWLINTLNELEEFRPLRDIVATGPPIINALSSTKSKIRPGGKIAFKVRTISVASMQWWRNYHGKAEIIQDHMRINEYSSAVVSYQTKSTDKGYFYLDVSCSGGYRLTSSWIYVGNDEISEHDRQDYINLNNITNLSITNEMSVNIVPSRESARVRLSNKKKMARKKNVFSNYQLGSETADEGRRTTCLINKYCLPRRVSNNGKKRVALLIGIMNYESYKRDIDNLKAPETDIFDLERVLLQMGFTVFCFGDLNDKEMTRILEIFSDTCIDKDSYVFFYFAGHGNSSKKVDYLLLYNGKTSVPNVLNILNRKEPRLLISIFDMCRNDYREENTKSKLPEANIPMGENLILIMSTLPTKEAYEQPIGSDNRSLIMKPLCENLMEYGRTHPINLVLTNFLNSCENIYQKPTMTGTGIPDIIGIDILIPRIKPTFQWLTEGVTTDIMSCVTIDVKTFHNFLNIYVDSKQNQTIAYTTIQIENCTVNISKPLNIIRCPAALRNKNSISVNFVVMQESTSILKSVYPIQVNFPKVLVPFLRLN